MVLAHTLLTCCPCMSPEPIEQIRLLLDLAIPKFVAASLQIWTSLFLHSWIFSCSQICLSARSKCQMYQRVPRHQRKWGHYPHRGQSWVRKFQTVSCCDLCCNYRVICTFLFCQSHISSFTLFYHLLSLLVLSVPFPDCLYRRRSSLSWSIYHSQ